MSGLDRLTFPATTAPGQTFDFDGELTAEESHTYAFSAASTFSNTVSVTATDRAGNLTTTLAAIFNDNVVPTVVLTVPTTAGLDFSVAWAATDAASGVRAFHLGYGSSASGPWTAWLTDTTDLSAAFLGLPDESYYFRVQAVDNVGNVSDWLVEGPVTINTVTKYYYQGGQRVAMRQGDGVYYLSGDHLGSTSLTTDSAGQVVHQARYLPYGAERWSSGAGVTDFGYTGQRNEAGFGLMDYNARYYSTRLGRFVSADTMVPEPGNPQAFNHYSYVRNNPLNYVDPSGHCGETYSENEEANSLINEKCFNVAESLGQYGFDVDLLGQYNLQVLEQVQALWLANKANFGNHIPSLFGQTIGPQIVLPPPDQLPVGQPFDVILDKPAYLEFSAMPDPVQYTLDAASFSLDGLSWVGIGVSAPTGGVGAVAAITFQEWSLIIDVFSVVYQVANAGTHPITIPGSKDTAVQQTFSVVAKNASVSAVEQLSMALRQAGSITPLVGFYFDYSAMNAQYSQAKIITVVPRSASGQ